MPSRASHRPARGSRPTPTPPRPLLGLRGLLGADLIGFHTYDYERHFLSSARRLLGLEVSFNEVHLEDRVVKVDSFPLGIDYKKFSEAARRHSEMAPDEVSDLQRRLNTHKASTPNAKFFLSIDRLDYTKGIARRIKAFEYFLQKYPEYKEKVRLIILAVPSRSPAPRCSPSSAPATESGWVDESSSI